MASLFDHIGACFRSDGTASASDGSARRTKVASAKHQSRSVLPRILSIVATACAVAGAAGGDAMGGLVRRQYKKVDMEQLAQDAYRFKNGEEHGRYWQTEYITSAHGDLPSSALRVKKNELKSALTNWRKQGSVSKWSDLTTKGTARPWQTGAGQKKTCKTAVIPSIRKRCGTNRNWYCKELDEEVWLWFTDRLATNKSRVMCSEITDIAQSYANAIIDDWKKRCDDGHASRHNPPKLPKLNGDWVKRWRHRYNVSYRTVNMRYKIGRKTFLSRLQVFWSNCIIMRKLYELMYPGKELYFVGFDQKPLWFNAISNEKTFTTKGVKKTGVAENVSASRARFTAMTNCCSWLTEKAPGIAVLFRIGDAACSLDNLRESLEIGEDTLIQGGPKGSYRLSQVLEFLGWAVKPAAELGKTVCVVLDWFAPHLDKQVDELIHSLGP